MIVQMPEGFERFILVVQLRFEASELFFQLLCARLCRILGGSQSLDQQVVCGLINSLLSGF
jgi:hypothetical protein